MCVVASLTPAVVTHIATPDSVPPWPTATVPVMARFVGTRATDHS